MIPTRERIITATNELFRTKGYNGTSVKDIVTAADAPTGSVYHFFPGGKAELAAAVLTESGAAYEQLFELIAGAADDPADAVVAFFDGAAEVLEQTDFIDVCPIGTVAREVASTDDALRSAADAVFISWIEALSAHLRRHGCTDVEADALATTVVATLEGSFVLARCRRDAGIVRSAGRHVAALVPTAPARRPRVGTAHRPRDGRA